MIPEQEPDETLRFARGIVWGCVIGAVVWGALTWAVVARADDLIPGISTVITTGVPMGLGTSAQGGSAAEGK